MKKFLIGIVVVLGLVGAADLLPAHATNYGNQYGYVSMGCYRTTLSCNVGVHDLVADGRRFCVQTRASDSLLPAPPKCTTTAAGPIYFTAKVCRFRFAWQAIPNQSPEILNYSSWYQPQTTPSWPSTC